MEWKDITTVELAKEMTRRVQDFYGLIREMDALAVAKFPDYPATLAENVRLREALKQSRFILSPPCRNSSHMDDAISIINAALAPEKEEGHG